MPHYSIIGEGKQQRRESDKLVLDGRESMFEGVEKSWIKGVAHGAMLRVEAGRHAAAPAGCGAGCGTEANSNLQHRKLARIGQRKAMTFRLPTNTFSLLETVHT